MTFTKGHTLWNHPNCKKSQFKHGEARHSVPHSVEAKLKMSESRKGKTVGSTNPSWKGGVTPLLIKLKRLTEYKNWQKGVFARDNYTCRSCSIRGCKTLTAHHLVSFSFIVQMLKVRSVDEAREQIMLWNIRNGVTLCEECHKQTANYAWRANKKPRDRAMYKIALLFVIFLIPAFSQAATFGYTTIGASSQTCFFDLGANELSSRYGGIASTTEIGSNLVSISGYYTSSIVGDTMDVFLAFNERDGAGSNSHSQIGSGESSNIDDASFPRWVTVSATGTITTGVDYVISGTCTAPDGSASASSVFDSVAGAPSYREDFNQATEALAYTAAQENPWTDTVSTGNLYSFYVTYDSTPQTILRLNNGTIRINNGTLDL